MEGICIVRHGDFDAKNGKLTDLGRRQITDIALQIKKLLAQKSAVIITSTAPRALESSEIISAYTMMTELVPVEFLWSHPDDAPRGAYYTDQNPSKVMDIVTPFSEKDIIILVSHFEVVNQFPRHFMQERFAIRDTCPTLEKGQALYIDIPNKRCFIMRDDNSFLEEKLTVLHGCLSPSGIPDELPQELSSYTQAFNEFKQSVQGCSDCFDEVYITALREFRDILLAGIGIFTTLY